MGLAIEKTNTVIDELVTIGEYDDDNEWRQCNNVNNTPSIEYCILIAYLHHPNKLLFSNVVYRLPLIIYIHFGNTLNKTNHFFHLQIKIDFLAITYFWKVAK